MRLQMHQTLEVFLSACHSRPYLTQRGPSMIKGLASFYSQNLVPNINPHQVPHSLSTLTHMDDVLSGNWKRHLSQVKQQQLFVDLLTIFSDCLYHPWGSPTIQSWLISKQQAPVDRACRLRTSSQMDKAFRCADALTGGTLNKLASTRAVSRAARWSCGSLSRRHVTRARQSRSAAVDMSKISRQLTSFVTNFPSLNPSGQHDVSCSILFENPRPLSSSVQIQWILARSCEGNWAESMTPVLSALQGATSAWMPRLDQAHESAQASKRQASDSSLELFLAQRGCSQQRKRREQAAFVCWVAVFFLQADSKNMICKMLWMQHLNTSKAREDEKTNFRPTWVEPRDWDQSPDRTTRVPFTISFSIVSLWRIGMKAQNFIQTCRSLWLFRFHFQFLRVKNRFLHCQLTS